MSARTYPSARERILDAAESLILKQGALRLTLDAVARAAKVSKGGLMYHFPGKEQLLLGLMERLHDTWIAEIEAAQKKLPPGPLGLAQAMLDFCFKSDLGRNKRLCGIFSALAAVHAYQPALLDFARRSYGRYLKEFKSCPKQQGACLAVMTSLDGIWWSRVNGMYTLSPAQESALHKELQAVLEAAREKRS